MHCRGQHRHWVTLSEYKHKHPSRNNNILQVKCSFIAELKSHLIREPRLGIPYGARSIWLTTTNSSCHPPCGAGPARSQTPPARELQAAARPPPSAAKCVGCRCLHLPAASPSASFTLKMAKSKERGVKLSRLSCEGRTKGFHGEGVVYGTFPSAPVIPAPQPPGVGSAAQLCCGFGAVGVPGSACFCRAGCSVPPAVRSRRAPGLAPSSSR